VRTRRWSGCIRILPRDRDRIPGRAIPEPGGPKSDSAPEAVLKQRVTARATNEFRQEGPRRWVDVFHARTDLDKIRDFLVSTHDRSEEDSAHEIIDKAGWLAPRR
jgi:hypothetical protein